MVNRSLCAINPPIPNFIPTSLPFSSTSCEYALENLENYNVESGFSAHIFSQDVRHVGKEQSEGRHTHSGNLREGVFFVELGSFISCVYNFQCVEHFEK